jgi:hypothetical protein
MTGENPAGRSVSRQGVWAVLGSGPRASRSAGRAWPRCWLGRFLGICLFAAVVGWPAAGAAVGKVPQSITFGQPPGMTAGTSSSLSALASSGLTVLFTSDTLSVCTVSGSAVTAVAAGTCTITASQAGNADYAAAPPVTNSFQVSPARRRRLARQRITFGQPPGMTAGRVVSLSALASSGLTVLFTSDTPGVCTVSGSAVTAVAAGTCTITASQAGNADYAAAPPVTRSFRAGPAAARKPVIVLAGVILAAAIAAGTLAVRRRWLRPHPPLRPSVRAEPQAGPPDLVSVHATGTDVTHTVRIEPHPGATVMTTQEVRP